LSATQRDQKRIISLLTSVLVQQGTYLLHYLLLCFYTLVIAVTLQIYLFVCLFAKAGKQINKLMKLIRLMPHKMAVSLPLHARIAKPLFSFGVIAGIYSYLSYLLYCMFYA
jgi:hypothetical protein